jgi:hypothetical protein
MRFRFWILLTAVAAIFAIGTPAHAQVASFALTYVLADGNTHVLTDSTAIPFPATDVNSTSTASITIINQGTASGTVNALTVSGAGFQVSNTTALPAPVGVGQTFRFGIVFTPTQAGPFTGSFNISLSNRSISGTLSGSTTSSSLAVSYVLSDGNVHALSDGTAITFPSVDVNGTTTATFTIANQGTSAGTVNAVSVSGTGFLLSNPTILPASIPAGQSLRFAIGFAPTRTGSFTGTFRIDLVSRSYSGTLAGSTPPPNLSMSYIDPDTSNVLPLGDGSTLQFPATLVGATASITLLAGNTGSGTGSVNSITLGSSTSPFQLLSLPPLPVSVPPAQQLRFGVRFSPQQKGTGSDVLKIDLNGQVVSINLQGQATQAQYTYGYSPTGTGLTPLPGGGTLAVADTAVGQTSSVVVSVTNAGTGDGQIANIAVSGQGLSLSNLPNVPVTLHANGSQTFTLTFAPTQPGAVSGRLTVGSDTFTVNASGIGSRLVYSYNAASSVVSVSDGGSVIFPPLAVGSSENVNFSIQNTGTSSATISSINLAAASTVFGLAQLPSLPMNLDPNATVSFTVSFLPNTTGSLTATLRVNSSSFTLSGNGTQPVALSAYSFQGPSGNQQPAQQPVIGLTLASPYPLALQGTLKLSFVSAVFTDDPSIQFATGGRTVNFTIPANSTQALFGGNATTVPLQTGTTAGSIVITPSFAMQSGFDLTPASPASLTLTIPPASPQLLSASISAETLNSFTLVLNGFATTRALRQLTIDVTPKSGQSLSSSHLVIDVTSSSAAWFQSTTSQPFGGSFLVAVPFILSNGAASSDLVHMLESLSITATNDVGSSSSVSVTIP